MTIIQTFPAICQQRYISRHILNEASKQANVFLIKTDSVGAFFLLFSLPCFLCLECGCNGERSNSHQAKKKRNTYMHIHIGAEIGLEPSFLMILL